jgi:hypothetical protein
VEWDRGTFFSLSDKEKLTRWTRAFYDTKGKTNLSFER